jgi:Protein of unknown function (DUF2809)
MKNRYLLLSISLVLVTFLGFGFKFYQGFGQEWVNNNGAAIWYEVFWCLFAFWFFPTKKAINAIPIWVFVVTCILEILQIWKTPILQSIRATLIGRLLLGTTFAWWDFPHYVIGSLIGWLWLHQIYVNSYKK